MKLSIGIWLLAVAFIFTDPLFAKVYSTKDDALKRAFPEAETIKRDSIFLTEDDVRQIEALSKGKVESKLFTYYKGVGKDGVIGYAFLDSNIVRTKPEVYMVVIKPNGNIDHVEILAFYEPEEYLPSKKWLGQFVGKRLNEKLWINRDIQAVTGATLSSYGLTKEVRKVLAIFETKILEVKR